MTYENSQMENIFLCDDISMQSKIDKECILTNDEMKRLKRNKEFWKSVNSAVRSGLRMFLCLSLQTFFNSPLFWIRFNFHRLCVNRKHSVLHSRCNGCSNFILKTSLKHNVNWRQRSLKRCFDATIFWIVYSTQISLS